MYNGNNNDIKKRDDFYVHEYHSDIEFYQQMMICTNEQLLFYVQIAIDGITLSI